MTERASGEPDAGNVDPYCLLHGHLPTAYSSCSCHDHRLAPLTPAPTSGEPDAGDVEALARVLAESDGYDYDALGLTFREVHQDAARAVLAALPALGYRKDDPARTDAGQPQVVAWCISDDEFPGDDRFTADEEEARIAGNVCDVARLVRESDALAYADRRVEQQRQVAVGDGQVVVDQEQQVDAVSAAIRDNVALLVLASGTTLAQFEQQIPGIVRAIAAQAVAALAATRPDETREQA